MHATMISDAPQADHQELTASMNVPLAILLHRPLHISRADFQCQFLLSLHPIFSPPHHLKPAIHRRQHEPTSWDRLLFSPFLILLHESREGLSRPQMTFAVQARL